MRYCFVLNDARVIIVTYCAGILKVECTLGVIVCNVEPFIATGRHRCQLIDWLHLQNRRVAFVKVLKILQKVLGRFYSILVACFFNCTFSIF